MELYEISKFEYNRGKIANYGGGYTAEDVKTVLKGYKPEIIEHDENTRFFTRKGSKFFYIVTKYNAE